MTEKQNKALEKIIADLPNDYRKMYQEIADYVISLGYLPLLKGVHGTYVNFSKSKVNKTILKIVADPKFPPHLEIKFFANPKYSEIFKIAVENSIELHIRTGFEIECRKCGKCDGTHGYTHIYSNGKQVFLCGISLVSLPPIYDENIQELKELLKVQDEFFMKQISK